MSISKNESIDIKPMMNGFKVEYAWREAKSGSDPSDWDYRYMNEEYMFKTWDEVVEFVRNKELETPPAKI